MMGKHKQNEETYRLPKNTKSLKELYDSGQYHCWVNTIGDVRIPKDGKVLTYHNFGSFEKLPDNIQSLCKQYWTKGLAADIRVVTVNGEPGIALGFDWNFSPDFLSRAPSLDDYEDIKACGFKFAEWMGSNAPAGVTVYYGDGIISTGDRIVAFIPAHLCPVLLGQNCKQAMPLINWAWMKAHKFLENPKNYQFRTDITTTVPTWALIEDVQKLRKALMAAHLSDSMSMTALKDEVGTIIECLEYSIANDTSVPEELTVGPSSSSLIAPDVAEGIIVRCGGSDIECAAGKPISHAMAGGVCQCDNSCPHFKECFTEDGMPRYGAIMPMQMNGAVGYNGDTIVKYLDENLK